MNCSRCQTELSDSATYCTTCGTPTRVSVPTPFSYLPAGTPPWPSSVPQGLSFTTNATSTVAAKAPVVSEKPKMSARGVLIAIAVLILVPLLGAAITFGTLYANGQFGSTTTQTVHIPTPAATAAATATPAVSGTTGTTSNQLPAASSFQKANGTTNIGVALKYPANWAEDAPQASTTSSYVRLHPQQSKFGIVFVLERFSASTSTSFSSADDLNNQLLQSVSSTQGVHNLQPVQSGVPHRTIGGASWSEQDTAYTDDAGNKIRLSTISVQHNKLYYTILIISPDIYYDEAMQKYIQPMFASLQFLS